MSGLAKTKKDIGNLLKYAEELLASNEKVALDLAREVYPHFPEHQVSGLEGVEIAIDGETWLRARRLREVHPPACDPMFEGWADFGPHPSPEHPPRFIAERMVNLSIEEISDLSEAGLLPDPDDVMRPVDADAAVPERMDVILRTANMPEFRDLWNAYLKGAWSAWAEVERPRRRSIDFYNKIYQIHQRMLALGDDTPIELVFGVGMARWKVKSERINMPLIEQLIEVELEEDGTLLIHPRQMQAQFTMRAFHELEIDGSKTIQRDVGQQFEQVLDDPDRGFYPFDKSTFESVLRTCSARLSESGIYHPDTLENPNDRSLPAIDEHLRITDTWTIFVRQRNEDFRKQDIRRLLKELERVEDEAQLPPPGVKFVVEPSDALSVDPDGTLIDLTRTEMVLPDSPSGWHGGLDVAGGGGRSSPVEPKAETYFFPLPYNDDQKEIIRRLEEKGTEGVLVQGPPGTGKTHTIANIICHYLATKRRVLVTAKTPEALTALQEKIPEGIRDLAIAVIHNDREGARQLEHAVRILADEAKSISPKIVDEQIREKQARIADLRGTVAKVDTRLYAIAERNLARQHYGETDVLPMDLARSVAAERPLHAWFDDDLTMTDEFEPRFSESDINEIRRLRRLHAGDLIYGIAAIPDPALLPELPRVLAAHGELARINEIVDRSHAGEIPFMSLEGEVGLDGAKVVRDWVKSFSKVLNGLQDETWLVDLYHTLIGLRQLDSAALEALKAALSNWLNLYSRGREFSLKAVTITEFEEDPAFDKALEDLSAGRQPFGMFSFFKGGLKARIEAVRIEGRVPVGVEDWAVVHGYRIWQRQAVLFLGRWSGVARVVGMPPLPAEWRQAENELLRIGQLVERIWAFHEEVDRHRQTLKTLFPYGLDLDEALLHGRCERIIEALAANLEKAELADAHALKFEGRALAGEHVLPFHSALREVCDNLGRRDVPQTAMAEAWQRIAEEAKRLHGIESDLSRLDALVTSISESGAPRWAERLRTVPPVGDDDPLSPTDWRRAWEWARADGYLRSLGDREIVRQLADERARAEVEQKKLFAEVVRLRTFLGLKQGLTNKVEAALAKFAAAIARLGKGTGKTAGRQRRIIREAAMDTAQAVPCWILPEWRVAEQLPPDLAAFDLVVIDEASQSDITAFPAIMRGKKVLIVGDDKQVSPTVIGLEDRKIVQLRTTFLTGLPFADQMDPATSLYELGGMVFPGKAIMLREHFRCVEPIIRFSSRFYPKPLVPLRIPKASERLDPPLIDLYVPHGRKVRDGNSAEADVIVAEIGKLTRDPAFENRSIGVISLIGAVQAKNIYDRLVSDLGAELVEKHRIMCGNSATFQGQERDIVFLSMVACPSTAMSQNQRMYEQRFNVAASRARDRLILVRSVASSDLKPGDLKLALIEHFRNPMESGSIIHPKEVLDLCDSDFERDFGRCLLDLGYRIKPQVPVGGYRIDFVVEGADDRRLAIELDGDKYHGPDKWAEDIRRQKALERLGWVFWRCWGSAWISDRQGCVDDLLATMTNLGIEPLGMAAVDGVHTMHVEVQLPMSAEQEYPEASGLDLTSPFDVAEGEMGIVPEPKEQDFPSETLYLKAHARWKLRKIAAKKRNSGLSVEGARHLDPTGVVVSSSPLPSEIQQEDLGELAIAEFDSRLANDSGVGDVADIGDLVTIRYADAPGRPIRIRLSRTENKPADGVIHVAEPLGAAVLGASVDDEVEVRIGGTSRMAVIEMIEKALASHAHHAVPEISTYPSHEENTQSIIARQVVEHGVSDHRVGCDLGDGAILWEDEEILCFLHKRTLNPRRADGSALAKGGGLHMDGRLLVPQRGAWLQAALRTVQQKVGDISETTGDARVLNAWDHWFARRDGRLVPLSDLRTKIRTRSRSNLFEGMLDDITPEDLGL